MTLFSVVIPTNASGDLLNQAVRSVLRDMGATADQAEILVVADGLTVQMPPMPGVTILKSSGSGISAALNTGAAAARGRYIVRMDADDVWARGRFADLHRAISGSPDLIAGAIVKFGGVRPLYERPPKRAAEALERLLHNGYAFAHPACAIKRQKLLDLGGYRSEFDGAEDLDMWLRLLTSGHQLATSARVHVLYRVRSPLNRTRPLVHPCVRCLRSYPAASGPCPLRGCPGRLRGLEHVLAGGGAVCRYNYPALGVRDMARMLGFRHGPSVARAVARRAGGAVWGTVWSARIRAGF